MKKFLTFALALLFAAALAVYACFDSDPDSLLGNSTTTITGGNGSSIDVGYVELPGFNSGEWLEKFPDVNEQNKLRHVKPVSAIETAFPFTLNLAFSGFLDEQGRQVDEAIGRMTLFYYSKSGGWMILRDIVSPQYEVVSDAEKTRALFGRQTIPSPLGYADGDYIPVVFYFETASGNYASFDLDEMMSRREFLGAVNFAPGANVLAIVVRDNTRPL